jgi:hypothetical protein
MCKVEGGEAKFGEDGREAAAGILPVQSIAVGLAKKDS